VLAILRGPKRVRGPRLFGLLGLALAVQCAFLEVTGPAPVVLWVPCMAVAVGLMFAWIALCCDISLGGAAYCTVRAFLLAELAASLEWQLDCFFSQRWGGRTWPGLLLCLGLVYGAVFAAAYRLEGRGENSRAVLTLRGRELWPPLTMGVACFAMSNLSFLTVNTPFTTAVVADIYSIRTLVDLAGVAMLFAYHAQRRELLTQQELAAMQNTLQTQYDQYCRSQESIDLIDRKYHDLKHQIAVLRAEPDADKRSAYLDEMESGVADYAAQHQTGSPVLDTVLTGKAMQCARYQIELTCVADGGLLGFMDVMDVCTVFGNLLDNAIECERTVPEADRRLITLKVYGRKRFVVVHCENYCPAPPVFQDGLPVTTKGDRAYHGYGLRSVRAAAEKYGGSMTVHLEDQWFRVNLLLPTEETTGLSE
jgi:hypothetical protein